MKLKYKFYFQHLGDQWLGVPVGEESSNLNAMLHLNDVGHDIAELLTSDTDREAIIAMLLDTYDAERSVVETYVDESLNSLREQGLLDS
ncbi:MAG: PqqD family protein [Prevotella sp.]|nr:PqqD family protein [Prevotella sp.]